MALPLRAASEKIAKHQIETLEEEREKIYNNLLYVVAVAVSCRVCEERKINENNNTKTTQISI